MRVLGCRFFVFLCFSFFPVGYKTGEMAYLEVFRSHFFVFLSSFLFPGTIKLVR